MKHICEGKLNAGIFEKLSISAENEERYKDRVDSLLGRFGRLYPQLGEARVYSAPGRTEIGGNHTDHQRGCVLAAAVNIDALAAAQLNGTNTVVIDSEGYEPIAVCIDLLEPEPEEKNLSAAMVRGVAAYIAGLGYKLGGFSACVSSDVPGGSGLSSSACFEVLIGTIFNEMFCGGKLDSITIAKAGRFAENNYAMKPSGLLDQAAASVGGLTSMDFSREDDPVIGSISFDFRAHGYELCVVDTGGSHSSLTGEYAAITEEMRAVSRFFGKELLSEVDESAFRRSIKEVREAAGDRAVLRAMHYFAETKRALEQAQALRNDDIDRFLALVNESGRSSELNLQNIYPAGDPRSQGVTLCLSAARSLLGAKGAYRVHGGGFAGTVQAYVPCDMYDRFVSEMENIFGRACCRKLSVRPVGGIRIM